MLDSHVRSLSKDKVKEQAKTGFQKAAAKEGKPVAHRNSTSPLLRADG